MNNRHGIWVLRTDLGLTGTKYGCGESYCCACTVLVDDETVRSCQTSLKDIKNKSVITIEGLAKDDKLHPIQKAFMENDALQCGYCTPGLTKIYLSPFPKFLENNNSLVPLSDRLFPFSEFQKSSPGGKFQKGRFRSFN